MTPKTTMKQTRTFTMPEIHAARRINMERNIADDAQWLFDLLFARAEKGDGRSRRLLVKLSYRLGLLGATPRPPTWPPSYAPERLHEIADLLGGSSFD